MSDVTLELIARKFNCVDIDDLNQLESDIAMLLVEDGYLDSDDVFTDDNEFLYSELHYVPIDSDKR